MVVEIVNIKNLLGIKDTSEDVMINEHLQDAIDTLTGFSDMTVKYYACYLVSTTITASSRVQKDADVTYFKNDASKWYDLFNEKYEEDVAKDDTLSDYALIKLQNVRVD